MYKPKESQSTIEDGIGMDKMTSSKFVKENQNDDKSCEEAIDTNDKTQLVESGSIGNLDEGN